MRQELKGRVEYIAETRTFDSGFQVRDFVVEIGEEYPQYIKLQCNREDCKKLDSIQVGMDVHVEYFLNGRKWNGPEGIRYFTTLRATDIQILDAHGLDQINQTIQTPSTTQAPTTTFHQSAKNQSSALKPPLTSAEVPKATFPPNPQRQSTNDFSQKDSGVDGDDMPF